MLTKTETGYLALTLLFLAAGSGIKAYRHAKAKIGPFPDPAFTASTPLTSAAPGPDSLSLATADTSAGFPIAIGRARDSLPGTSVSDSSNASSQGIGQDASRPPPAAGKSAFTGKVNLNRAETSELTHVKGIGEKTAQAIVQFRKSHGRFRDLRDLLQVKGIGEKKLEKLRAYLIL